MARGRRRRGASASRGPKNQVWTVIVLDELVVSSTTQDALIVDSTDWAVSAAASFERATLLRIRGWLSLTRAVTVAVSTSYFFAIYITDEDAAAVSPADTTMYTKEDVIWTGGFAMGAGNASSVEQPVIVSLDIDVKSMRKITSASQVRLGLVSGDAAANLSAAGVIRALV